MTTVSRLFMAIALMLVLYSSGRGQSSIAKALEAIKAGDVPLALRLLDNIADVNVDNGALLYEAVLQHQPDTVEKLLTKGADPNLRDDLLRITIANKWDSLTLLLLGHRADPNRHSPYGGTSPLSEASSQGNTTVMRALIEKRADVNYNDYVGSGTPLILAVEAKQYDAAQILLDNGADASIGAKFHGYPWDIAREAKDQKMLDLLMRYMSNCKEEPDRCM
jgi:ankyrin repeat protein